jgi:outer membrane protein TolC
MQQLIIEQRRLVDARSTLVQAGLEAYRARVELSRAIGE